MRKQSINLPCLVTATTLMVLSASFVGCNETVTPPAQAATPTDDAPANHAAQETQRPQADVLEADPFASESKPQPEEVATDTTSVEFTPSYSTTSTATAVAGTVEVPNANVEAMDTVEVPAQEAGVIRELIVTEGDSVTEGGVIGKIDDDRSQIELQLAKIERDTSKEQAENQVNLKFAVASERVAELEHRKALEANGKAEGTFSKLEVEQLLLAHQRSEFQVDQAKMEMKIAGMTLVANESRVKAAEKSLTRRQITTPRTGVVVKLYKRAGEWVDPGDPVLRMVRSDRMRVEGYMNAREYDPHTVLGKPVRVTVELARGRKVQFDGVVKLPDLTILSDGKYRVWAEVENKKDGAAWLLRPGQRATMAVKVGE